MNKMNGLLWEKIFELGQKNLGLYIKKSQYYLHT